MGTEPSRPGQLEEELAPEMALELLLLRWQFTVSALWGSVCGFGN